MFKGCPTRLSCSHTNVLCVRNIARLYRSVLEKDKLAADPMLSNIKYRNHLDPYLAPGAKCSCPTGISHKQEYHILLMLQRTLTDRANDVNTLASVTPVPQPVAEFIVIPMPIMLPNWLGVVSSDYTAVRNEDTLTKTDADFHRSGSPSTPSRHSWWWKVLLVSQFGLIIILFASLHIVANRKPDDTVCARQLSPYCGCRRRKVTTDQLSILF